MTWDPVWEKIFRERATWGYYPPEELIRFIAKNYYSVPNREDIKILEVGCGPGGGPSWYIAREEFSYYGIDGSQTAIEKAKSRFLKEGLKGEFVKSDLNNLPWPDNTFDCIIDIACLQCNCEADTEILVKEIYRVLKHKGNHFSLTSKSGCWGDGLGTQIDDTSYKNVTEGPFSNMGIIRFATRESLKNIYSKFKNLEFNYSIRSMNNGKNEISNWIFTCEK